MQATRREILDILRRREGATVDELSRRLGLTPTCVRQHLSILEREALVTCREVRRKLGRPQYVYALTESADDLFPKSYHLLTAWILDELKMVDGQEKALLILEGIARRWAGSLAHRIMAHSLADRVVEVVGLLNEEGHMVEWERQGEGFLIHEYDCRFHRVAQQHPEICSVESQMLLQLLRSRVESKGCLLDGQGRCTYYVSPLPEA